MTKSLIAKFVGWGQFVVAYLNTLLDGQPIPSSRSGWMKLAGSALLGAGVHIASNTSAGHPDGANTAIPASVVDPHGTLGR